jgi:hypothetical protein
MPRRIPVSIRTATALLIATVGLALACSGGSTEPGSVSDDVTNVAATVAQVAAAVTGQNAPLADAQLGGSHLGFDTHTYPGDRTMQAWKSAPGAPYKWVGYYLPSPCHKDASWTGKRQKLTDMGWGLAAVYVGQQTWGRTPRPMTARKAATLAKRKTTCDSDFLSADRGTADGIDAAAVTAREGFAPRSTVFLDIERMERMPMAMRDYYRAWARALLKDGRYLPGVYVHAWNAQVVHDDLTKEFAAAGEKAEPRIWVATGHGFDEGKAPQDVGFEFAGVWQGMIDVARRVADIRLPVDVNVSSWTSPSEPSSTPVD